MKKLLMNLVGIVLIATGGQRVLLGISIAPEFSANYSFTDLGSVLGCHPTTEV